MAVIAHVVLRNVTRAQYDEVRAHGGWLEEAPIDGIAHLTCSDGADCHDLDARESEAAFQAFGEGHLGPTMARPHPQRHVTGGRAGSGASRGRSGGRLLRVTGEFERVPRPVRDADDSVK